MNVFQGKLMQKLLITGALAVLVLVLFAWTKVSQRSGVQISADEFPAVDPHQPGTWFTQKVWLHRVNSIERARTMQHRFRGFEIDVNFDPDRKCLDITHDVADSVGLCLDNLLEALDHSRERYYWLDFKNLSIENQQPALRYLTEITDRFVPRERVIVESQEPELLGVFTERGYYTSYYLPYWEPEVPEPENPAAIVSEIADRLSLSNVSAISGYHFQYPFMIRHFPDHEFLTWDIEGERSSWMERNRQQMLADPRVKVMLISVGSVGYR